MIFHFFFNSKYDSRSYIGNGREVEQYGYYLKFWYRNNAKNILTVVGSDYFIHISLASLVLAPMTLRDHKSCGYMCYRSPMMAIHGQELRVQHY